MTGKQQSANGNPQDLGRPDDHVGFLLRTLHLGFRQALEVAMREQRIPLSFAQVGAMLNLSLEPGLPGAQLARRAGVAAQTMNAILRRLETGGLIRRSPHPESRRADSWYLTEDGDELLGQARRVGDVVFSRVLSVLSAAEIEAFKGSLGRCIAALGPAAQSVPECGVSGNGSARRKRDGGVTSGLPGKHSVTRAD